MKDTIFKKLIIIFIVIIMISNFIMPNYTHASEAGEKLVSGFFYLIAFLGDAGLSIMQDMMMGTSDLIKDGVYQIEYSPGIIFSNEVPALDIDFIGATEEDNVERDVFDVVNSESDLFALAELLKGYEGNIESYMDIPYESSATRDEIDKLEQAGLSFNSSNKVLSSGVRCCKRLNLLQGFHGSLVECAGSG